MDGARTPTHIEHIGIAVKDLDAAVTLFQKLLGVPCYAVEEVADQKVKTAFFRVGLTKIELLESTAPDGPVGKFIERRGEGIHHIALAVPDVRASLRALESSGIRLIDPEPRPGAEGLATAFLHPASTGGVLMELCGKPEPSRREKL
jgi:methylmalonyl-CoA/ethylmalonyl-CoA epimerase